MLKILVFIAILFTFAQAYSYPKSVHRPQLSSHDNRIHPAGNYKYQFDTTNSIVAQETGIGGVFATGTSEYYSPEGELIRLSYTADENGFHPQGAHLPTPPPIPAAILRGLEYIRTHPKKGEQEQMHNRYFSRRS